MNVETTPTVLVNIKISVHNGDGPIDTMLNNNGLNIHDGLNFVRCEDFILVTGVVPEAGIDWGLT